MAHICIISSVHLALDNRVFYRQARSLVRLGYQVTLIALHDRQEVKDGVTIIPLPRRPRWQRPGLWWQLARLARATRADLYLFHDPELLVVAPVLRLVTGRPTVYDIHEVYPDFFLVKDYLPVWVRYPLAWTFRWLEPLLARLNSGLIFADDEIARPFRHLPLPQTTLFNFPGRPLIEAGAAATRTLPPRPPVVLYLGGMERNRGTTLMIQAFRLVADALPEARLLLVGHFEPPALQVEVQQAAAAAGLAGHVLITGRVPFETIGAYLTQAAVGWVTWQPAPKNEKNIPTKLFEYMAYALPIVSSDLPSTRPFVEDGVNGYRVPADDPAAHAAALLRLLGDPGLAETLGRQGQTLAATRFNWDAMEQRLGALVQTVLARRA